MNFAIYPDSFGGRVPSLAPRSIRGTSHSDGKRSAGVREFDFLWDRGSESTPVP